MLIMPVPELTLKIDLSEDIKNAKNFLRMKQPGFPHIQEWFLPQDLWFLLSKKFAWKERDKIIKEYTETIYSVRKKEILEGLAKTKKNWIKVEKDYYELVAEVFQGHPWPRGNYTGFASIFHMFPRYIAERTFFMPYSDKYQNPIHVICHEMLHFMFFSYIKKRYSLMEKSVVKGKPQNYVWQVSEVFNNVIENTKHYHQISGSRGKPYPGHEEMYDKMRRQWARENDINTLLDKWLKPEQKKSTKS
jgi:hypothetical protein